MRNTFLLNPKNHRVSAVLFLMLLFAAVFPLLAIIEDGPPSEESPSREKPADDPYGEPPADWPPDDPWPPRDDDDDFRIQVEPKITEPCGSILPKQGPNPGAMTGAQLQAAWDDPNGTITQAQYEYWKDLFTNAREELQNANNKVLALQPIRNAIYGQWSEHQTTMREKQILLGATLVSTTAIIAVGKPLIIAGALVKAATDGVLGKMNGSESQNLYFALSNAEDALASAGTSSAYAHTCYKAAHENLRAAVKLYTANRKMEPTVNAGLSPVIGDDELVRLSGV